MESVDDSIRRVFKVWAYFRYLNPLTPKHLNTSFLNARPADSQLVLRCKINVITNVSASIHVLPASSEERRAQSDKPSTNRTVHSSLLASALRIRAIRGDRYEYMNYSVYKVQGEYTSSDLTLAGDWAFGRLTLNLIFRGFSRFLLHINVEKHIFQWLNKDVTGHGD